MRFSRSTGVSWLVHLGLFGLLAGALLTACESDGGKVVEPDVSTDSLDTSPPAKLAFTVQPSTTMAGRSFSPDVRVQIQDTAGTLVTSAKGDVTVVLESNVEGAALLGNTIVAAENGEAKFPGLNIVKAGSSYRLKATSGPLTHAISDPFDVLAGAPAKLAFSVLPALPLAGAAFQPPVEVQIQDSLGNATGAGWTVITVAVGNNPSGGNLFGILTEQAVSGGATFPFLAIDKEGSGYTLVASADGLEAGTSAPFDVASVIPGDPATAGYLLGALDRDNAFLDVYTDADAAGNHFVARGRLNSPGDESSVPPMVEDDACEGNPHGGVDCIRATFKFKDAAWGGWYFLNGVLDGNETRPRENWGTVPDAGSDLQGATKLTFWARGQKGGERVKFVALGVGWSQADQRIKEFPGSSPQVGVGGISILSTEWQQFEIDLMGKDLSYVLGGFAWVATADDNPTDITFFLDDIRFDKARLDEPRFAVSYEVERSGLAFDRIMRNVAFTYDNAITLLALIAAGDTEAASFIADALVYAQINDRFYDDGRLRNAYQGGDLAAFPGWTPYGRDSTVRLPGWSDRTTGQWLEDPFQVGTHTGNMAWAVLALLAYYEFSNDAQYLRVAEDLGDWIATNTRDATGAGGYALGYNGSETTSERLTAKSTEHNIDLYAAFHRLFLITGNAVWQERAEHAKKFVIAMWDSIDGKFWAGTEEDGVTIFEGVAPLEIQAWAALAFRGEGFDYWRALEFAEERHGVGGGFDFNRDRDGVWYEGTAHMALAYYLTGQRGKWERTIDFLRSARRPTGALNAADRDELTTGFLLPGGEPLFYYRRAHIAATAWMFLAESGVNPFWLEHVSR